MAKVKNAVEQAPAKNETIVNNDQSTANEGQETTDTANEGGEGESEGEGEKSIVAPEPTSEKLIEIRAKVDSLLDAIPAEKDRAKRLKMVEQVSDLQDEEAKELQAIKKAEIDAKIQAQRNEKLALVEAMIEAAFKERDFKVNVYDKASDVEKEGETGVLVKPADIMQQMNDLTNVAKNAREAVENELLSRVGGRVASTTTTTGTATASKGETGKKIIELYESNRATGMKEADNIKAIIAAGFARGTTGAVTLAYRREKGLEPIV